MIDKNNLYGEFLKGEKWRRNLAKSATHKALDIAEAEDVNLSVNKSTGVSTAGMIGVALAAGLGPALLGIAMLFKGGQAPTGGPADSAYQVIHYDEKGNVIPVKHISEREKK